VRSAETIERDARAWELRVEHPTYQQIGDELVITKEGARQAVERHAKTIPVEAVADVKQIVLEELDVMSRHLLETAHVQLDAPRASLVVTPHRADPRPAIG
jgi:hypothetical protein